MAKEGAPSYWDGTSLASRISSVCVFSGRLNSSSPPSSPTSNLRYNVIEGKNSLADYIQGLHYEDTTNAIGTK